MEVVNMSELFDEIQNKGVGAKDHIKYKFIINILSNIREQNAMRENTDNFNRKNARKLIVKMYDHYNDDEVNNDKLSNSQINEIFTEYAYQQLELLS